MAIVISTLREAVNALADEGVDPVVIILLYQKLLSLE